ncbi:response regulator [Ideonella sp.]|uniref:response regulator n=1 Tax=Ideonella sp. TaxID=1929293 RepID=UPI0037C09DEF
MIEDDIDIASGIGRALQHEGFCVTQVRSLKAARQALQDHVFDLFLLDLGLPDGDGMSWLRELRTAGSQAAVLILSARDRVYDRVLGLQNGADDYLMKPFEMLELSARVNAMARRVRGFQAGQLSWAGVSLDEKAMRVLVEGRNIALSKTQYELLRALLLKQGSVVLRSTLERVVLPCADSTSLDMHVSNLRKKIGAHRLRTVRGVGYVIDAERRA